MSHNSKNPRVLIVTPEVSYLPDEMGTRSNCRRARAGGLGDMSAALIHTLYYKGVDIHLALPDYRTIFNIQESQHTPKKLNFIRPKDPLERIHLAKDSAFFHVNRVYSGSDHEIISMSLAFQREVIHHIVPEIRPDLIHCNDWMTSLIPAMARELKIPCLFSIHNIHTVHTLLSRLEDSGLNSEVFWRNLYYSSYPGDYKETRDKIPLDYLVSGIFASHFVNTVSPTFLEEIITRQHDVVSEALMRELSNKKAEGCAEGILNAPDPSYGTEKDRSLICGYSPESHLDGKKNNKLYLQKELGLIIDPGASLFFWPSRLDPIQKGCELLSGILYNIVSRYWDQNLEIVFVADGPYQKHFHKIVRFHDLSSRVAVCDFNEQLSRIAYAASDFILMPSRYEPCGLSQMIGSIYGSLPIARETGGIRDTVSQLDVANSRGNGFLFKPYDPDGLSWAIDQGMNFFQLPIAVKDRQISRIMRESKKRFCYEKTASQYMSLYEKMLNRPLVCREKENNPMVADLWPPSGNQSQRLSYQ